MDAIKVRAQYFSMMVLRTSTGNRGDPIGDEEVAGYLEFLWVG